MILYLYGVAFGVTMALLTGAGLIRCLVSGAIMCVTIFVADRMVKRKGHQ